MKKYSEFINEDITKFMTPKSENDISKGLEGLSDSDKIKSIIKYQLDFDLLPRDEDGYCNHVGNLAISNSNISKLPDNLNIDGSFYCSENNMGALPNGLIVNGNLYCSYNELTTIPSDLVVTGNMYCPNNKIKLNLPSSAIVNGRFVNRKF